MPSTATITAFYNFTANTKARASQVNTNFDNFRGHLIPISPLTATSANNTYDLGSNEYRWRDVYSRSLNLNSNTTTGSDISIEGLTSGSSAAILFKIGGTEYFRVQASTGNTSTAAIGQFAVSSGFTAGGFYLTGTSHMAGTTITISSSGKPIDLFIQGGATLNSYQLFGSSAGSVTVNGYLSFYRGSTLITSFQQTLAIPYTTTYTTALLGIDRPLTALNFTDFISAGTYNYSLHYNIITGAIDMPQIKLYAKERLY